MDVLAKLSLAINVTAGIEPKFAASGSIGGLLDESSFSSAHTCD